MIANTTFCPGALVYVRRSEKRIKSHCVGGNDEEEEETNEQEHGRKPDRLLINIGTLDKGHTHKPITEYISADMNGLDARKSEVRALREGLNDAIMPLHALFDHGRSTVFEHGKVASPRPIDKSTISKYVDGPTFTQRPKKGSPWKQWRPGQWISYLKVAFELKNLIVLRSRLALHAANLNLFLTRLTHIQLQRHTELLTLKLAE